MIVRETLPADTAAYAFRMAGFEPGVLQVTAFDGTEGLSQLFDFRVQLCSDRGDIDPDDVVGRAATLEIIGELGVRYVHGIIRRFGVTEDGPPGVTYYEAHLVPPHWLLTRRIHSRVFQTPRRKSSSVPGIITQVLEDAGFVDELPDFAFSRTYENREFVVQYRESDWDFLSRLMEEEGIYYYFEHAADRLKLVITDQNLAHKPFVEGDDPSLARVPYSDPNGMVAEQDFIHRIRFESEIQIGAVTLDDFNFRREGDFELRSSAQGDQFAALRMTDYPGGYQQQGEGQIRAQRRLEEHQSAARVAVMGATVRQFYAGATFELTDHPNFNGQYLITQVTHRALQTQGTEGRGVGGAGCRYDAQIRVIPASRQYRPPRVTPKARVQGSQTAIVVGPPNDEIHTDEFGRVRVRFHWDQEAGFDENASCWIRVSQAWAGGQYGAMFLPRVGQEVIVDFLEGDPDQPIVTGRVYNHDHMPPYKLPDHKSISTIRTCSTPGAGGGNEIRFDDAKKNEQLMLFAQRNLHVRARGSRYESIGGSRHLTVGKSQYEHVKEHKHSTVTLDRLEDTKGSLHVRVAKDVKESVQGRKLTFVSGKYAILSSEGIVMESDTAITLKVKGNFIKVDADGVTIVGKQVKINSGGAADTWTWDSPDLLELPTPADSIEYGHNKSYATRPESPDALGAVSFPADAKTPPEDENEPSWIEIELVDDFGEPCPGELFEIRAPGLEQPIRGVLDDKGRARVAVPEPGACQVGFPKLDKHRWERA
jgi:type VI secretion system secreted protein VgrG